MNMLQSNKTKIITIVILVTLGIFSIKLLAQDKDGLKDKLDNLKGKVEKLTVKVDGKDVVFEGKDAERLVKRLRTPMGGHAIWIGEDEMGDGPDEDVMWLGGDDDLATLAEDGMAKKINVEDKDGKKKVTVTTTKDGKEETKVYEGDEAEKFLKDERGARRAKFFLDGNEGMPSRNMMYFTHRGPGRGCCCCCGDDMPMSMRFKHGKVGPKKIIIKEFDKDTTDKKEENK